MGFLNIAIILRILLGFFQVFYAIFRDFLGFWDSGIIVRFWDFSKDFFLFLMKCTKIFRVIYPSGALVIAHCVFEKQKAKQTFGAKENSFIPFPPKQLSRQIIMTMYS
jgi:hypothetical protein